MSHVLVKVHENVATLVLDRPEKRNTLSPAAIEELKQALADVHQEKRLRSVVICATGSHFCSGIDLGTCAEIADMPAVEAFSEWYEYWRTLTELFEVMLRFPKPVIAAVDGAAVGAGLGLVMACDLVVASTSAVFLAPATRRGLVGGATAGLIHFRLGGAVASRLLIGGETLTADDLYRIGACRTPVDSSQVWLSAVELAKQSARGSAEAIQATKRMLNESIGEQLLTHLAAGAASSATVCTTEAASEGIRAFLEKRDPVWP